MLTDEELLRDRLDRLLGQVSAGPPPVDAVLRRGMHMRIGHRVVAAAVVVVVGASVAAAVTGIGQLHRHHFAPVTPNKPHHRGRWPVQSVFKLAGRAHDGVIAEGTSKSLGWKNTWRVWIDTRTDKVYAGILGVTPWIAGSLSKSEHVSGIATFHDATLEVTNGTYAAVAPDVTRIVVTLNNGQRLTLYPVAAAGHRWVGLLTVYGYVLTGTAYSGRTELGHFVAFDGQPVTWLRPGQSGLAVQSRRVGTGFVPMHSRQRWSAVVQAGPWGYCISLTGNRYSLDPYYDCITPEQAVASGVKHTEVFPHTGRARWLIGTAGPSVAYLKLDLADGTTIQVPTVAVDGQLFYALAIVRGQVVVSWGAYDAAGHKLYGGVGAPRVEQ